MTKVDLISQIFAKQSFLCVGLDSDPDKLPTHLGKDAVLEFNKAIIEATSPYAVAYKINTAFYEATGQWELLKSTIDLIPFNCLSILDAKRGDIGNTSAEYAKAFFDNLNADALTVAPYMGEDSIRPFLDHKNKWTIALALTSNTGSKDFQQLRLQNGNLLFEEVIAKLCQWGNPDQLMLVAGATHPDQLAMVRKLAPDYFLLVPGVGAQGGSLDDVCQAALTSECGLLVNSSRQIIYASNGSDFAEAAGEMAKNLQSEMAHWLTKIA